MKRKRFTEEQISYALRQAEAGTPVAEICRKLKRIVADLLFSSAEKRWLGQAGQLYRRFAIPFAIPG